MKKIFLLFFLVLFISAGLSRGLEATKKNSAVFTGSINGQKVRFLSGEVAVAGASPYLLLSILHGGDHWMFDIKGIRKTPGKTDINFYVMHRKNRKLTASYRGSLKTAVQKVRGKPAWRGSSISTRLKSRKGKVLHLKGVLYWNITALPAPELGGTVKLKVGSLNMGPAKARVSPWNNGVQIEKLFVVKPGETLTMMLRFPSKRPGTYTGSLTIMHFKMAGGKMVSSILKGWKISVVVSEGKISFFGEVADKKEKRQIKGLFLK